MIIFKSIIGAAIPVAVAVLVGGCGSSDGDSSTQAAVSRPSADPPLFHQTHYDVETTWPQEESDKKVGGYLESVWHDPAGASLKMTIDSRPSEGTAQPLAAAEIARAEASTMAGYDERSFKKITAFGGPTGIYHAFEVGDEVVIGFFFAECGTSIFLHGNATPTAASDFSYFYKSVVSKMKVVCDE